MFSRYAQTLCFGLVYASVIGAAPPDIKTAEKVSGEVGEFIPLRTETSGKFTRFVVVDKGLNLFPADLLADKKATVVSTAKAGTYRVIAYTGNNDGPSEAVWIVVTVGGSTTTPNLPVPDPNPPKQPVDPTGKLYFLVVRGDGAATPEFTKTMSDPAWTALRSAGHSVKDRTQSEAKALGVNVPSNLLPAVVTLRVAPDNSGSVIVRPAIPLPTTSESIGRLPEGI